MQNTMRLSSCTPHKPRKQVVILRASTKMPEGPQLPSYRDFKTKEDASTRAKLSAQILLQRRDNLRRILRNLRIRQRRRLALQRHPNHERIFPRWHIFPSEQIRRFNRINL